MAEQLKKLFRKKKLDLQFKKAGPGHRLNEDTPKPSRPVNEPVSSRSELSDEAKQAAAAALARLQNSNTSSGFRSSSLYKRVNNEVQQELNAERNINYQESLPQNLKESKVFSSQYAAEGVYFRCPLLGPEVLSKVGWRTKIREYLYEQLENEKGLTACLIIRNCNNNVEKINICTETLCKYLQNIINHPDEDKYKRIRMSNKVFQDRVAGIEGALEFLEAAGFAKEQLAVQDGVDEFLVYSEERNRDPEYLKVLIDALENAERIELELDRNIQVLQPSQAERRTQLPDDFFRYSPDELKKEHLSRSESLENSLVLRTKAMRLKQEQREMKKYRYALIRIRFPEGIFLQGTFSVYEKFEDVVKFVQENLDVDCPFSLLIPDIGKPVAPEDYEKSLVELHLVPASVLIFQPDQSVINEKMLSYLKPEVAVLLQDL